MIDNMTHKQANKYGSTEKESILDKIVFFMITYSIVLLVIV